MADLTRIPDPAEWYAEVPRSITRHAVVGLALIVLGFGGFGYWAFSAPLAAAVISQGSFVATGQNKIVQHLEGGIIGEILVEEGDAVTAGAPILRLDETLARASSREVFMRQIRLQATQARLLAQNREEDRLTLPAEVEAEASDPEIAAIIKGQQLSFSVAHSSLANDIQLIARNIDALDARQGGLQQQLVSFQGQIALLDEELEAKGRLLESGLMRQDTVTALKRLRLDALGQVARLQAESAEIDEMRAKFHTQIEKTRDEYRRAALTELEAVQAELESVREQMRKARDVLERTEVLAPVTGTVVRLYYHTAGGVIETGRPIAEILPDDAPLIIETLVSRGDIDSVKVGQTSTVRLVALNQRTTPILNGRVDYVSADAVAQASDKPTAREVYIVRVSLAKEELGRIPHFIPRPGMPVEIMIKTEERTFAQYIAKPIIDSMARAFREQ